MRTEDGGNGDLVLVLRPRNGDGRWERGVLRSRLKEHTNRTLQMAMSENGALSAPYT